MNLDMKTRYYHLNKHQHTCLLREELVGMCVPLILVYVLYACICIHVSIISVPLILVYVLYVYVYMWIRV